MELTTMEQPLRYLRRTALEPVYQELTAEVAVPERLSDIDRILDAWGTVLVQEKHCDGGELRLSGGIQAGILYAPEGGEGVELLEAWLPFTVKKSVDTPDGCLIEHCWLKSIDARSVNPRKALLRANLGAGMTVFTPEELQLVSVESPPKSLQLLQNSYPLLLPVGCGEHEFRLQDELSLPNTVPAIDRILKWELAPNVEESRMIGEKAVFQGDVVVTVLYLGTDGSINTYVGTLPYSQYAELGGEWPDGTVAVFPSVVSVQLDTDGQMESRTILADLRLNAQVCVIDQVPLRVTEDAYALGGTLEPVWQDVSLQPQLDRQQLSQQATLQIPVKAKEVVQISMFADQPTLRCADGMLIAASGLNGNLLYRDESGSLRSRNLRGEGSCTLDADPGCRCKPCCRVSAAPESRILSDAVEVRVPLEFDLTLYQDGSWKNLAGGTVTEQPQARKSALIVRRWQGGELWPLAKQLGSTVSDIQRANALPSACAPENEILLIPIA